MKKFVEILEEIKKTGEAIRAASLHGRRRQRRRSSAISFYACDL